jgi:hypothetical protein
MVACLPPELFAPAGTLLLADDEHPAPSRPATAMMSPNLTIGIPQG